MKMSNEKSIRAYLGLDIETTGLEDDCLILEIGLAPVLFDIRNGKSRTRLDMGLHLLLKCPPYETLAPSLNEFVKNNNQTLIEQCHRDGIDLPAAKNAVENYLSREDVVVIFGKEKPTLMIKSAAGVDLPFLNRDFSRSSMRAWFSHRILDVTSVAMAAIDKGLLPPDAASSSWLAKKFLAKKDVKHRVYDDIKDMAVMYESILRLG